MQKNIYQGEHGGWIVEFRQVGDRSWTTVGVFGTYAAARARYAKI